MLIRDFYNKMSMLFPDINGKIDAHILEYGERMDTIVIEEIIMPEVISLLNADVETEKLQEIFCYFEDVSACSDKYLHDVFKVTVLEMLGNDIQIFEKAKKYMGPKTKILQKEVDISIGRKVSDPNKEEHSYPEVKCHSLSMPDGNIILGLFIASIFLSFAAIMVYKAMESARYISGIASGIVFVMALLFFIFIGLYLIMSTIEGKLMLQKIASEGELLEGVVLRYEIDPRYVRNPPRLCVIVIETSEGKRIIKYSLTPSVASGWQPPFMLNEVVDVLKYKNYYYVLKREY
ncbi:MAG: hypothetical protein K6G64_04920 [Eubacterium sp.]|nr:hypothetical protein [Eubacterium sp.]